MLNKEGTKVNDEIKILIVDDDDKIRKNIVEYLKENNSNFKIWTAADAEQAIHLISEKDFEIIIADMLMNQNIESGLKVLKFAKDKNSSTLIFIMSAFVKDDNTEINAKIMACQADAFINKNDFEPYFKINDEINRRINNSFSKDYSIFSAISKEVSHNEGILEKYIQDQILKESKFEENIKEPVLAVARRWNSWYPSLFDVIGGAYAIIMPKQKDDIRNVSIIDPGFRSLYTLRKKFNINVNDIRSCIITHNHPDHISGIFEYITSRHISTKNKVQKDTRIFCNPTVYEMLNGNCGENNHLFKLNYDYLQLFETEKTVGVKGIRTVHQELSKKWETMGLDFHFNIKKSDTTLSKFNLVILGDTSYNPILDKDRFLNVLCHNDVKVIVLHIGSSQYKERLGGHLYSSGLLELLIDINIKLSNKKEKVLVLISEWGLEHATRDQLSRICSNDKNFIKNTPLNDFSIDSLILKTIDTLKNQLTIRPNAIPLKMDILPADIGLTVGLESGKIYLSDKNSKIIPVSPQDVKIEDDDEGLKYTIKNM